MPATPDNSRLHGAARPQSRPYRHPHTEVIFKHVSSGAAITQPKMPHAVGTAQPTVDCPTAGCENETIGPGDSQKRSGSPDWNTCRTLSPHSEASSTRRRRFFAWPSGWAGKRSFQLQLLNRVHEPFPHRRFQLFRRAASIQRLDGFAFLIERNVAARDLFVAKGRRHQLHQDTLGTRSPGRRISIIQACRRILENELRAPRGYLSVAPISRGTRVQVLKLPGDRASCSPCRASSHRSHSSLLSHGFRRM